MAVQCAPCDGAEIFPPMSQQPKTVRHDNLWSARSKTKLEQNEKQTIEISSVGGAQAERPRLRRRCRAGAVNMERAFSRNIITHQHRRFHKNAPLAAISCDGQKRKATERHRWNNELLILGERRGEMVLTYEMLAGKIVCSLWRPRLDAGQVWQMVGREQVTHSDRIEIP